MQKREINKEHIKKPQKATEKEKKMTTKKAKKRELDEANNKSMEKLKQAKSISKSKLGPKAVSKRKKVVNRR